MQLKNSYINGNGFVSNLLLTVGMQDDIIKRTIYFVAYILMIDWR